MLLPLSSCKTQIEIFITVFQLNNFIYFMRKLTGTKTKLVINRMKRGQTPPKLQMEVCNSTTTSTWAPVLVNRDTNLLKFSNSSIARKELCQQLEKKQRKNQEMVRCRSLSSFHKAQTSKNKFVAVLPVIQPDMESKPLAKLAPQETIHECLKRKLQRLKENGIISIMNSFCRIHQDHLLDLIQQFSEKSTSQDGEINNKISEQSQIDEIELDCKKSQAFRVYNQYSFHQINQKKRKLTQHSLVVDQHHLFQQEVIDKQTFWRTVEEYQTQPSQQKLLFLLDNLKIIKQEISQRQTYVQQLAKDIEQINRNISNQEAHLRSIQEEITERSKYLRDIEQTAKEMENFIDRQPNRILQQQAKEYKERQQELFDLAFLYQQQFPSSVPNFIHQSIMIPYESFKLTIQSFPHQELGQCDNYSISKKSMDDFKASLKSVYESTIDKLSAIIQRKTNKIKNFIGIMRRLASYTIGKREYLEEINKKMAVVSIHIDKNFNSLEDQLTGESPAVSVLGRLDQLRQLFQNIKKIYCEAEVFY